MIALVAFVGIHTLAIRSIVLGTVSSISMAIMYLSPMTALRQVMITQNTELIPFWVCFAGLLNGIDWVIYGRLINLNLYIVVGNAVGVAAGAIQILVYFYYTPLISNLLPNHTMKSAALIIP
ncbi:bidirectional sugar transporter SWEET4-like [Salvia hispanica]|uniref:bidirectional sugar transporter SWEET4-like n=1 Tax=Salvia hispanica TaxID=49212 RepID=UPI002009209B|nr:bidirectional sugar transporter SWEET4-like [Salvia hispanica]